MYYDGWEAYHSSLAEEWAGQGTWTYNVPGVGSVTYKDITINPSLPDSVFQP
jgi:outer membrane lipoprotein-sorting protein